MIQQGDDTAFAEVANGDNITVHLDSPGGNLGASLRIGQLIRSKQYGTVVPAGAVCASGCAFVWVSGVRRELGKGAWLLVHCARRPNESTCDPSSEAPILSYLLGMGAPQKMLEAEKRAYSAGPVAQFLVPPDTEGLVTAASVPEDDALARDDAVPMPRPRPVLRTASAQQQRQTCPLTGFLTFGILCF
jgi:hypothetical protein